MKKVSLAVVVVVSLVCCSVSFAAPLFTAADFVPPVQVPEEQRNEALTVKNPDSIVTSDDPALNAPVTTGMSVQDAINAIAERHEEGCSMVATPEGGYGFVATGMGTYRKDMKNLTALRIAQRNSYVHALMQAKAKMAEQVEGFAVQGYTNFDEKITTLDNGDEDNGMRNREAISTESIKTTVAGVLKGYVTYNVFDDFKNGIVYVTIVSTPKTRGVFSRVTSDTVDAETINDGLNAVLAEIQSGLVPLVGGRIVEVPKTGEIAFVGFGSAVVRQDKDPAIRNSLLRTAQSSAALRAADALCGIIIGDITNAETKLDQITRESVRDFTQEEREDPINGVVTQEEIANAKGRQTEFRNRMEFSQTIETARRGVLPPGVIRRAWLDDEGAFAYALAIYIPSVTNAAASGAKEMRDTQIVQPVEPNKGRLNNGQENANSDTRTPDYKDSGEFRQGISGTIKQSL